MRVHFPDEIKEYENTNENIDKLIGEINQYLKKSDRIFSHLNVNGLEVYTDHHQHLLRELSDIEEVQVILKSKSEAVSDLHESLNEYLVRALPAMEQLSGQFYKGESKSTWTAFVDFTDGLQWITGALNSLSQCTEGEISLYYKDISSKIETTFIELNEALEAKDTVTIADMIQYEIAETLADVQQKVHH